MNSIGFGRSANVLIHTPEASAPKLLKTAETSATKTATTTTTTGGGVKAFLANLKPSNWRSQQPQDHAGQQPTQPGTQPTVPPTQLRAVTLDQLDATPLDQDGFSHLLTFDLLRYAVFATTETIDLVTLGQGRAAPPSIESLFQFAPTVLSSEAAANFIESQLADKVAEILKSSISTANSKFSGKKNPSGSITKIIQTKTNEYMTVDIAADLSSISKGSSGIQMDGQQEGSASDEVVTVGKVKVNEWVREEESVRHSLIRVAAGMQKPLQSFAAARNEAELSSKGGMANEAYIPYTLHFFNEGPMSQAVSFIPPKCNKGLVTTHASDLSSLPTINSLSDLTAVDGARKTVVVRLFQDSTTLNNSNSSDQKQASPKRRPHPGHEANCYDNDDGFGASPSAHPFHNTNSITDGGAHFLLRNWASVEDTLMKSVVGPSAALSSSSVDERPTPSWVKEIISAIQKEVSYKNDAIKARTVLQQGDQSSSSSSSTPQYVVRLKHLCFVPYVICHPATTRRANFVLAPLPTANTVEGGGEQRQLSSAPFGNGQVKMVASSESLRSDPYNFTDRQKHAASIVRNNETRTSSEDKSHLTINSSTAPTALMLALNCNQGAVGISSLDGVLSEASYIVSILPKYGS